MGLMKIIKHGALTLLDIRASQLYDNYVLAIIIIRGHIKLFYSGNSTFKTPNLRQACIMAFQSILASFAARRTSVASVLSKLCKPFRASSGVSIQDLATERRTTNLIVLSKAQVCLYLYLYFTGVGHSF